MSSSERGLGSADDDDEDDELIPVASKSGDWRQVFFAYVREGHLDTLVPLVVLVILSIAVLVYNCLRPQIVPCDPNKPLAKHFYCHNASAAPGVHKDNR